MEDVVGLKVRDPVKGWVGFMTWGRIVDAVEEQWLIDALRTQLSSCGIGQDAEIIVCDSLQEVSSGQYFYEALWQFSIDGPRGGKHKRKSWWKKRKREFDRHPIFSFLGPLRASGAP